MINSFAYVKLYVREGWITGIPEKRGDPRMQFNSFMLLAG